MTECLFIGGVADGRIIPVDIGMGTIKFHRPNEKSFWISNASCMCEDISIKVDTYHRVYITDRHIFYIEKSLTGNDAVSMMITEYVKGKKNEKERF